WTHLASARGGRVQMRSVVAQSILLVVSLIFLGTGRAQELPGQKERLRFEEANTFLNCSQYAEAAEAFEGFVRDFPDSKLLPEALFKGASARLLQGKTDEAGKLHRRLASDHSHTPWGYLAAYGYLTQQQVFDLALEKRKRGAETSNPTEIIA